MIDVDLSELEINPLIIWIIVGVLTAIVVVVLFVLLARKRQAEKYFEDCKTDFVNDNKTLIDKCNTYGRSLCEKYDAFGVMICQLGLAKSCSCSSAVVSNSESSPIKYIIKYSDVSESVDCLSKLDRCIKYTKAISVYYTLINEIRLRLEAGFPKWVIERVTRETMLNDVLEPNDHSKKILFPQFEFFYSSPAGRSQRSKTITITSDVLEEIRSILSAKMERSTRAQSARSAMTNDLRAAIKLRDNYTCKICGNSVYNEPNLLLEVDHIIPVSKGGKTEASNLQTLCWRCNRTKGNRETKIENYGGGISCF